MTDNNHTITPPPELVQKLWGQCPADSDHVLNQFATLMARWGADQSSKSDLTFVFCCVPLLLSLKLQEFLTRCADVLTIPEFPDSSPSPLLLLSPLV